MPIPGKPQIQTPLPFVSPQTESLGLDTMQAHTAPIRGPRGPGAHPELAVLLTRVARDKDRDAFGQLFVAVSPQVKGMLLRQGADHGTAEEIVQETFLTVWRKADLYSSERGSATTWIYTIARNLRIDRIRREVPWQELGEDQFEQASDDPLQDDILASQQIHARMRSVLETLPAEQREVVTMAYVEGLAHGEIAGRLGIPLGTVKSRMRLAYQKIKDALPDLS